MKRIVSFAIAAVLSMGLAQVSWAATKVEVEIENFAFSPKTVTINQGDTVEWKNRDAVPHTSTSGMPGAPDGLWDSGVLSTGGTYSRVFDSAGTFAYYCKIHTSMTGSVVVQADTTDTIPAFIIENEDNPVPLLDLQSGNVEFSVINSGSVNLAVYDAAGNQVAVLAHGYFTRGEYSIPYKQIQRGVYFLRLVTGESVVTRKVVQIL